VLTNLDGLAALTSVGGDLRIWNNSALTNLDGLAAVTSVGGFLYIYNNAALDNFCGLFPLIDASGLVGTYTVTDNATNPTEAEILAGGACLVSDLLIDIKPWSITNPINPKGKGVIPVAILSSDTFDALEVDVNTLAFGPDGAATAHNKGGHLQDVNDDGLIDLLSHYFTQETGIAFGDTEACVTGELFDGTPFEACDDIRTMPNCGIGFELVFLLPGLMWLRQRRRSS
jgi:hypothetical protein